MEVGTPWDNGAWDNKTIGQTNKLIINEINAYRLF